MGLVSRAASLASVPVNAGARMAGAATAAAFGADKDAVYAKATAASVEALTAALAKARGPALKFGQALAVFSSALPPEQAQQLAALSRLYEDATPQPIGKIRKVLDRLPDGVEVEPVAVAAASLGQVHRGIWTDGTPVAIKVQYPDAPRVVKADMLQLKAMAPMVGRLLPTLDVRALVDEHAARLAEELDYTGEASWQEAFRQAWDGQGVVVPRVLFATETVLVTEWVDGVPFTALVDLPGPQRNAAGRALARFAFWSPRLVGATHADPHPGNFRLLPDGQLAVLDFGSVAAHSGLFTCLFADTMRLSVQGRLDAVREAWVDAGLIADTTTTEQLMRLLDVDTRPYTREEFTFSREWLQTRSQAWQDPVAAMQGVNQLRFPPDYLLEHRAVMGSLALLCSIDATVDFHNVLDQVGSYPFR